MGWTDDRVDLLTKLWRDGLSASQIACQLGGVTRNAVIGKAHRLGLSGRAAPARPRGAPSSPARRPSRARSPRPPRIAARPPLRPAAVATAVPDDGPGLATSATLAAHMCRWPIGDPKDANFTFCGVPVEPGPYCDRHAGVAYRAPGAAEGGRDLTRALRRYLAA